MDNYPQLYLQLLQPYIRVHFTQGLADSQLSTTLTKYFNAHNVADKVWDNCVIRSRLSIVKYIIGFDKPDDKVTIPLKETAANQHSILSPFNKDSKIFPNGILIDEWFTKYVQEFPFALVYVCRIEDSSRDHQLVEKITKLKTELSTIDCKLTVILTSSDTVDEARLSNLKHETDLPRSSDLIYLNDSTGTVDSDCETAVNMLLSSLKEASFTYYNNIEYKIKQRNKKYYSYPNIDNIDTSIELTPKFLETRNIIKQGMMQQFIFPHNLGPGIKLLEIGYQSLITILNSTYAVNLSQHDNRIIAQIRELLDITAFHIVRGYFSLEDPLKALTKHKTHILNVTDVIKDENNWESIQYEWLGQLMSLVPYSLISTLGSTALVKQKNSNIISYYGGLHLPEFDITTNPGLVYVKAYEKSQFKDKRVQLLCNAIQELELNQNNALNQSLVSGSSNLNSFILYINWLVAEELYPENKVRASDYYEMAYSSLGTQKWSNVSHLILEKLLYCYNATGNKKLELNVILKLSSMPYRSRIDFEKYTIDNIFDQTFPDIDIIDSATHDLFNVEVFMINKDLKHDISIHDLCILQVSLNSNLNTNMMESFFPEGTEVKMFINQLDVHFTRNFGESSRVGFKSISITNDDNKENVFINKLAGEELDMTFVDSANLEITNKTKIIQHIQNALSSGDFHIDVVKLQISVEIKYQNKKVQLNKIELHSDFPTSSFGSLQVDAGRKRNIRLERPGSEIKVFPVKPDIRIEPISPITCYIPGEKLAVPVRIEYKNKELCKKGQLVAKVKSGDVATSWDNYKDEEPLDLELLEEGSHTLFLYTRSWNQEFLNVDLQTITDEEGGDDSDAEKTVYDTASISIPVLPSPFIVDYLITPSYRDDTADMPSPFILPSKTDHNMPIAVRLWEGKLKLFDQYELFMENTEGESLEVVSIDFNIISKNPELIVDLIDTVDINVQLFTTKSKSGFSHRNVEILSSAVIRWKRRNSELVFEYQTPEWEIKLPLSEPRVLFRVEKAEEDNEDNDSYKLQYILENPTPRIFTFTTELAAFESEWDFERDERNVVPIKQAAFPVLPFSRHYTNFYGHRIKDAEFNDNDSEPIKLPSFKVFDIQYKVALPTIPVSPEITIRNSNLYINK